MKLLVVGLMALVSLTFMSGCASDESEGGYGRMQQRMQHAGYDPTGRLSGTTY
jgi:hypothetical protein